MQYLKQWIYGWIMAGLAFFITGCFFPGINQEDVDRLTDRVAPEIVLVSPVMREKYGASVLIAGQVADYMDPAKTRSGRVASLVCEIPGTAVLYPVETGLGVFRNVISTAEYSGTLNLKLTATDWNGNVSSVTVQLLPGPFAAFNVNPGNGAVTLSWEPVPAAGAYTIYYTDDGSLPAPDNGKKAENAEPPFTLAGLQNGVLYSFVLKAAGGAPGVQDNWSHAIKTIPLSPFSLFPGIDCYIDRLELRWERIPGTEKYLVYRSTSPGGVYTVQGGDIAANYYADKNVVPGCIYYYKIAPALAGCRQSEAAAASLSPLEPFCPGKGTITGLSRVSSLAANTGCCYVSGDYNGTTGVHCFSLQSPVSPVFAASIPFAAPPVKLAVTGSCLAVLLPGALYLVDITDAFNPGAPVLIWQEAGAPCLDLAASGSCLYLLRESAGIIRIDLADPGAPQTAAITATAESIDKMVIDNGKLYYIAYTTDMGITANSHLEIYDTNTGLSVTCNITDSWEWYAGAVEAVQDGTLIISLHRWDGGRDLFNVTEAELPFLFDFGYPFPLLELPDCRTVKFYRNFIFTGSTDQLIILNRQDNARIQYERFPAGVDNAVFYGDYLYTDTASDDTVRIFNIRTPFDAELTASAFAGTNGCALKIAGNTAYLVFPGAIQMYDFSRPALPALTGSIPLPGLSEQYITHMKIAGNYLFLANGSHFFIYNTTGTGSLVGQYTLASGNILDLQIHRDYVYLSCGYNGFYILDLSRVENPVLFYSFTDQLPINQSFLVAGYLYLVNNRNIYILDTAYLPTTRIIAKPPLFMSNIELGFVRYPQLFLFDNDIDHSGYSIGHIYSLALPQYPRVTEQDSLNFATNLPDSFSQVGTYVFGLTYRDLNHDTVPDIRNVVFDMNDFDSIAYIGTLGYSFTACEVNGGYLYTYNRVTGMINSLKLSVDN